MENMPNLQAQWHDNISMVDINDFVLGGDGGTANVAIRQLAESLLWLKNMINGSGTNAIQMYKVGDIYTTTVNHTDGNAVATFLGYGTWQRFAKGTSLIGYTTDTITDTSGNVGVFNQMGQLVGEYSHKLTTNELPAHTHLPNISNWCHGRDGSSDSSIAKWSDGDTTAVRSGTLPANNSSIISSTGGNIAHNNIHPCTVVGYWIRTA